MVNQGDGAHGAYRVESCDESFIHLDRLSIDRGSVRVDVWLACNLWRQLWAGGKEEHRCPHARELAVRHVAAQTVHCPTLSVGHECSMVAWQKQ
jgi:hypothetical protein